MICHLCELPFLRMHHHPLAPSRDHVIPRSHGGTGLRNNILPAHTCCSSFRRDRDITPELRAQCRRMALAEFQRVPIRALPAPERRTVITHLVASLVEVWHGDEASADAYAQVAHAVRGAMGNFSRKYLAPIRRAT